MRVLQNYLKSCRRTTSRQADGKTRRLRACEVSVQGGPVPAVLVHRGGSEVPRIALRMKAVSERRDDDKHLHLSGQSNSHIFT